MVGALDFDLGLIPSQGAGTFQLNFILVSAFMVKTMQVCSNDEILSFAQFLNPFMPNVFSHPCQLDKSISNLGLLGGIFIFIQILKETSVSKQWRTWSDAAFCSV